MTILFHPNPGTVLVCDFSGMTEPEMIKTRPVVVVSPRSRLRGNLCTIVPLSTKMPQPVLSWHFEVELHKPLSPDWPATRMWAKCDMIYTFGFNRLDRFYTQVGYHRKYHDRQLSPNQWAAIRRCVNLFLDHHD